MKTPREILFERHQGAQPKLDAIRQEALANLAGESGASAHRNAPRTPQPVTRRPGVLSNIRERLLALLWPSPWAWAGTAAAWMLIFAFNFSASRPAEGVVVARKQTLPASVVKMASTQRRLLMNSLLDLSASESAPPPRRSMDPRPHSERREDSMCA